MTEALLLLAAALLSLFAMGWFALAMPAHWRQVHSPCGSQPRAGRIRCLGVAALAGSATTCLLADHPSMAVLVWLMLLTAAAFCIAMLLSHAPTFLRFICLPMLGAAAPAKPHPQPSQSRSQS